MAYVVCSAAMLRRPKDIELSTQAVAFVSAALRHVRDAEHVPLVIRDDDALRRFASIKTIERSLWAPGFVALKERVVDLCTPAEADQ